MFRIAVFAAVTAVVGSGATASEQNLSDGCVLEPLAKSRAIVKAAWDRDGWRSRNPVKRSQRRQLERLRACLDDAGRRQLERYASKKKRAFKFHRAYRSIAPYAGFAGEGYLLRWLAVPRYIVACETNGYRGDGRWHASNGSTNGPYQFIGWPVPWPARTNAQKLAHHRMASELSLSNWACA